MHAMHVQNVKLLLSFNLVGYLLYEDKTQGLSEISILYQCMLILLIKSFLMT